MMESAMKIRNGGKRNEQTLQNDLPHGDVDRRACGGALFKCSRIRTVRKGL